MLPQYVSYYGGLHYTSTLKGDQAVDVDATAFFVFVGSRVPLLGIPSSVPTDLIVR